MTACGAFESVQAACAALVKTAGVTLPDAALTACYERQYQKYRLLYPALKDVFPRLQEE